MYTIEYNLTRPDEDLVFEITVKVFNRVRVEPNHSAWYSDMDYYGYDDFDWDIIRVVCVDEDGNESLVSDIGSILSYDETEEMNYYITEKLYEVLEEFE